MRLFSPVLWLVVACGDNHQPFEPVAPDMVEDAGADPDQEPTYYRDVAPILAKHCGSCHRDGGVGPFPLLTYEDASERSGLIADITAARVMPPYPADASGACNTFEGARQLASETIATLARWHERGAPLGRPELGWQRPHEATPFTATITGGPEAPFSIRPGNDQYRCFVIDPQLASDHYITALAMQLDRADVVHHMQLYAADTAREEEWITARDAADPESGFACGSEGTGTLRYIGVWAPGDPVRRWPDGTGIHVRANHRLVVQLHYHNHGSHPVADRTQVALELAASVATVGEIQSATGFPLNLPPGLVDTGVTGARTLSLRGPSRLHAVRVHMHELGTRARLELVRDGQATCLLDIPRWDFRWQLFYPFTQPIDAMPGDQLRITCRYDTTSRSEPTEWGLNTEDEMCLGYTYVTD